MIINCFKWIKSCLIVSMVLTLCGSALAAPYSESSFYSLYQQDKTLTYTDVSGVQKTQTRVGYRYQNDLTDSIVVCGKENDSACITNILNTSKTLRANYPGRLTTFKVYVPPGTSSVSLLCHVGQGDTVKYFTVARLGSPPVVDSTYTPSDTAYASLPYSGFSLDQLRNGDCLGKNDAGYLFIANDSGVRNVVSESTL